MAAGGGEELKNRDCCFLSWLRYDCVCKPEAGHQQHRGEIHHLQSSEEAGCAGVGSLGGSACNT